MPSIVEICNMALTRFGADTITSLTEASKEARQCNLIYTNSRDATLRAYPWGFATKVTALAQNSNVVIPGWAYAYQYPADCLLARKIFNDATLELIEPQSKKIVGTTSGRVILSNIETAYLEYTARITDPTQYDPEFVDALAWRLATDLAVPISGNKELREHCMKFYQLAIGSAQVSDASENTEELKQSQRYIECRW